MKKIFLLAIFLLTPFVALATFPVNSLTTVSEENPGFVKVTGNSSPFSALVQSCPDAYRSGCGNNITISPAEVGDGYKIFALDPAGVRDGQIAYSFVDNSGDNWLAIPSCLVKVGANTVMEMSYPDKNIPKSGGAHFVSTATGFRSQAPIVSGECGENRAVTTTAYRAQKVVAPCNPCEEIKAVKEDTTAIRASVGEVSPSDPADERTLQQKTRKTLTKVTRVEKIGDRSLYILEALAKDRKIKLDGAPVVDAKTPPVSDPASTATNSASLKDAFSGVPWWAWVLLAILMGIICVFLFARSGRNRELPPERT